MADSLRIVVLTPRSGGPYQWGRQLVTAIAAAPGFAAAHHHHLQQLLLAPFYQSAQVIHGAVPITLRLWSKPFVLTVKGDYRREKRIWRGLYHESIRRADRVTVPSQYLKKLLQIEEAIVIPNAIDLTDYPQRTRMMSEKPIVLTVTNFDFLDKAHGILTIMELLSRLPPHLRFRFQIVGSGKFLNVIRQRARTYPIRTEFVGFQDPRPFYNSASLFLYYSVHDNMPNVILEAMASSLPVITNNVGAVNEMIVSGQSGYIAKDSAEYLEKIVQLTERPERAHALGIAARERIEQRFNWKVVIKQFLNLYRSLG